MRVYNFLYLVLFSVSVQLFLTLFLMRQVFSAKGFSSYLCRVLPGQFLRICKVPYNKVVFLVKAQFPRVSPRPGPQHTPQLRPSLVRTLTPASSFCGSYVSFTAVNSTFATHRHESCPSRGLRRRPAHSSSLRLLHLGGGLTPPRRLRGYNQASASSI